MNRFLFLAAVAAVFFVVPPFAIAANPAPAAPPAAQTTAPAVVEPDIFTICSEQVNKTKADAMAKARPRDRAKMQFTNDERTKIRACVDAAMAKSGDVKGVTKEQQQEYQRRHSKVIRLNKQ